MSRLSAPVIGILLIIVGTIAFSSLITVRETEQVLILKFGEPVRVITEPGLHFKFPYPVEVANYLDKRVLDYDADSQEIPTADQKQLIVDAFARYRITNALDFYQTVGTELGMRARLGSIMNSSMREVLGDVPLSTVLTPKRAEMMRLITSVASDNASNFGIEVIDVRIKRVDLPIENSQAIFRRMQTQREQEARKIRAEGDKESRRIRAEADKRQRVIVAEARKQAEILRGEGDAGAQRIYNDAYTKDERFFDFWRSMQAMQRGLSSDTTTYVGPPDSDFFRFFGDERGRSTNGAP